MYFIINLKILNKNLDSWLNPKNLLILTSGTRLDGRLDCSYKRKQKNSFPAKFNRDRKFTTKSCVVVKKIIRSVVFIFIDDNTVDIRH